MSPDPLGDQVPSERIMLAAVRHAVFDGWTRAILPLGARDAGYEDAAAEIAFPGGVDDLIEAFSRWADDQMLGVLEGRDLAGMKMRARVALAVRTRLEVLTPYREAVRRLNAHCALPGTAVLAARLVGATVDDIWYAVGDTSTDFSYYTKRALLTAVYGATVLYWLADDSEDQADTWAFLDRRLGDVMAIPKVRARAEGLLARIPNPIKVARLMTRRRPI